MSCPETADARSFFIRTTGKLVGRGRRSAVPRADGLMLEPGGWFAWSDFAGYRGELPHTLIHRDGRTLTISQARNTQRSIGEMRACLEAMARAIAEHNAGRGTHAQLGLDVEGERRAAQRQRAGMVATAILAAALLILAWTVPAPMPAAARFLPLVLLAVGVGYVARLTRRLRKLDAQRRQMTARD